MRNALLVIAFIVVLFLADEAWSASLIHHTQKRYRKISSRPGPPKASAMTEQGARFESRDDGENPRDPPDFAGSGASNPLIILAEAANVRLPCPTWFPPAIEGVPTATPSVIRRSGAPNHKIEAYFSERALCGLPQSAAYSSEGRIQASNEHMGATLLYDRMIFSDGLAGDTRKRRRTLLHDELFSQTPATFSSEAMLKDALFLKKDGLVIIMDGKNLLVRSIGQPPLEAAIFRVTTNGAFSLLHLVVDDEFATVPTQEGDIVVVAPLGVITSELTFRRDQGLGSIVRMAYGDAGTGIVAAATIHHESSNDSAASSDEEADYDSE